MTDNTVTDNTVTDNTVTDKTLGAFPILESDWTCQIFGIPNITWVPRVDEVPDAWCRFWSWFFFRCKWQKMGKGK